MSNVNATTPAVQAATARLSAFVVERAEHAASNVGFSWILAPIWSTKYDDLYTAFVECRNSGKPLEVSSAYTDDTIFSSAADQGAFQFWSAVEHITCERGHGPDDDWAVAVDRHLWQLEKLGGFTQASLEYQLLRNDLLGSAAVRGLISRDIEDRRAFRDICLADGFDAAIAAELERAA